MGIRKRYVCLCYRDETWVYMQYRSPGPELRVQRFFFFAILGRGPRAFQIGKISPVNPKIGKFVIAHNYVIFGQ